MEASLLHMVWTWLSSCLPTASQSLLCRPGISDTTSQRYTCIKPLFVKRKSCMSKSPVTPHLALQMSSFPASQAQCWPDHVMLLTSGQHCRKLQDTHTQWLLLSTVFLPQYESYSYHEKLGETQVTQDCGLP